MTWRSEPLLSDPQTGEDAACPLPVFVVDVAAGALVAANAAGWRAWGLAAGDDLSPVALDQAMPALARLPQAARSPDGETLTFWTMRGLLRLQCRVAPIGSAPGTFLVRADAGEGAVPSQPAGRPGDRDGAVPAHADRARHVVRSGEVSSPALARLAHEVRTPLSAAIAYAELLKEEHFGPLGSARYREYARNAYDSARLALSVVDSMLAREPREPVEPGAPHLPELAFRDLDPAGVIDNCLAVVRPLAERAGLDLTASCDPDTPRVIADEVSLKQMLLNLITNAIKFARPGDRVTLTAAYGADGCLRLQVADTGPGMPSLPSMPGTPGMPVLPGLDAPAPPLPLSAPPQDAAGSAPGHGIGLPLTRALAAANGASLIVDSAPGRGTRVTIAFGKDRVVPV